MDQAGIATRALLHLSVTGEDRRVDVGAPAQVPEPEKDRRLQSLQALLREQQVGFNESCVGLDLPVLFTGLGRHPGQIAGRSPFLQPVHLSGKANLIGTELIVRIVENYPNSLAGTLVQERRIA